MELYKQIRQIARETAAEYETKLYYGAVLTTEPLSVKVDQRFILTAEFLSLMESVTALSCGGVVVRPGLAEGDRVVLIGMGNSDYLILDRVV